MYVTPFTAAERERAKKDARSDDPGAFALQLLLRKARSGNGQPLHPRRRRSPEERSPRLDLQKLMLAVLGAEEDEALDMKSGAEGAERLITGFCRACVAKELGYTLTKLWNEATEEEIIPLSLYFGHPQRGAGEDDEER